MNKTTTALTDAMTYAAIKYTRRFQERGYTEVEMAEDIGKACAEAALRELGNEWVRVDSEGLPDKYKMCLFYTEEGDTFEGFVNLHGDIMKGQQGMFSRRYRDVENPVTHWMPSPPKPKTLTT